MNPKIWKEIKYGNYDTETLNCLALAQLYDDPREGINNFEVTWNWKEAYEYTKNGKQSGGQASQDQSNKKACKMQASYKCI